MPIRFYVLTVLLMVALQPLLRSQPIYNNQVGDDFHSGILNIIPQGTDLGEDWIRYVTELRDPEATPPQYPEPTPAIVPVFARIAEEAKKAGIEATVTCQYRNKSIPAQTVDAGFTRYKDKATLDKAWENILKNPAQQRPIQNIGERAILFGDIFKIAPPQGNPPQLWFTRGHFIVWITLWRSTYKGPDLEAATLIDAHLKNAIAHRSAHQLTRHSPRIFVSLDNGASWSASDQGFPPTATVNDFAISKGIVLAGTESHGAYISTNAGAMWLPLSEHANGLPANLKINATAALQDTWFLGTYRHGIYKSTSPTNWSPANTGLANHNIRRLLASGEQLYAATDAGLFRSTNSAASWRHLHGASQVTGIAIHHEHIYYSDIQGILRSTDQGETFQRVLTEGTPHNLASTADAVFATIYGLGLRKSADDGHTWVESDHGLPTGAEYTFQIRPVRDLLLAAQWKGIYTSADQGTNWTLSSSGLPSSAITDIIQVNDQTILAAAGLIPDTAAKKPLP